MFSLIIFFKDETSDIISALTNDITLCSCCSDIDTCFVGLESIFDDVAAPRMKCNNKISLDFHFSEHSQL